MDVRVGFGPIETEVTDDCEQPCMYWESNLSALEVSLLPPMHCGVCKFRYTGASAHTHTHN